MRASIRSSRWLGMLGPAARSGARRWLGGLFPAIALLLASAIASSVASAQPAPNPAAAIFETARQSIASIETTLRARTPPEAELQRLRQSLEPVRDQLREVVETAGPTLEQARSQLAELGPKPAGGATESAELASERASREKIVGEIDEQIRLGRALLLRTDQLVTEIADRRRNILAQQLVNRGQGLFSLDLWRTAIAALPADWRSLVLMVSDWWSLAQRQFAGGQIIPLVLGLAGAGALLWGRAWVLPQIQARLQAYATGSRFRLVLGAILQIIAGTVPALIGAGLIFNGARASGLAPDRFEPVLAALLNAVVFMAFISATTGALLAPDKPEQRFFGVADRNARILAQTARRAAIVIVTGKIIEALLQSTAAALSSSILVRALIATVFALTIAQGLQRLRDTSEEDEACLGPYVPVDGTRVAPFRLAGWAAVGSILVSAALGYVSLATFLTDQTVWIFIIAVLATVLFFLVEDATREFFAEKSRFSLLLQGSIGLRRRSVGQAGVLVSGGLKLLIGVIALALALAPWGVESADVLSSVKAAFFGVKVGDVTISLSSLIFAAFVLTVGFLATRGFQRWLDTRFLPATDLDLGLRNSIKTGTGYLGIIIAIAIAFSSLGLSLDKLTIVAGALSVGIGFGLQSIVSNFVSGLILLWERPIRVGDLIVAGDGEGVVRRINVRSTEIETGDRSVVIVPNSNLVSGVVKNRVRSDRTGRVVVAISVPRGSSAEGIRAIMQRAAEAHPDVLRDPAPAVLFKRIGETALDFELVCVVGEINLTGRVSSDLHFTIFEKLGEAGIGAPGREVSIAGLDRIEDTLEDIAEAIENEHHAEPARSDASERPSARSPAPARSQPAKAVSKPTAKAGRG